AGVAGVGEVNAALRVDGQVVGAVEPLALPAVGEHADGAVFFGNGDAAIAARIRPLGRDETSLRVEVEPVRAAAGLAVDGRATGARVVGHDSVADVREVNTAVRPVGRSLGEAAVAPDF